MRLAMVFTCVALHSTRKESENSSIVRNRMQVIISMVFYITWKRGKDNIGHVLCEHNVCGGEGGLLC